MDDSFRETSRSEIETLLDFRDALQPALAFSTIFLNVKISIVAIKFKFKFQKSKQKKKRYGATVDGYPKWFLKLSNYAEQCRTERKISLRAFLHLFVCLLRMSRLAPFALQEIQRGNSPLARFLPNISLPMFWMYWCTSVFERQL